MLLVRRGYLYFNSVPKLPKRVPGIDSIAREIESNLETELPAKRSIESKPVRQRKRRNVVRRIYGTGYDHVRLMVLPVLSDLCPPSPAMATPDKIMRCHTSVGFEHKKLSSFYLPEPISRSASIDYSRQQEVPGPTPTSAFIELLKAVFKEIPVLAPLAGKLVKYLGLGFKAYVMLWRLVLFAVALSPAISKAGLWWWRSRTISRGIKYGDNPRNFLDIYNPIGNSIRTGASAPPVVIYVTGGAWIIGYKAWAAPLGEYLSRQGILMVSVDYRNFPQGTFSDMVEDVNTAIDWVIDNIGPQFGGDVDNIILVGQSAGAQITSQILLTRAGTDKFLKIKKFIGISGPYDMVNLAPHFNTRGLYRSMLTAIMDNDLFASSPIRKITSMKHINQIDLLPPILILHGTSDCSVPYESSVEFVEALQTAGAKNVQIELWDNVSHSEPLVEGPAAGNNFLGIRIAEFCDPSYVPDDKLDSPLASPYLIRFAKFVMPF